MSKSGIKWDSSVTDPELLANIHELLLDVILVKETLKPHFRSWVPEFYTLHDIVLPYDGGIEAYGAAAYARSTYYKTAENSSRVTSARGKVSKIDSGDNELSASLLAVKVGESVIKSLPEKTTNLRESSSVTASVLLMHIQINSSIQ